MRSRDSEDSKSKTGIWAHPEKQMPYTPGILGVCTPKTKIAGLWTMTCSFPEAPVWGSSSRALHYGYQECKNLHEHPDHMCMITRQWCTSVLCLNKAVANMNSPVLIIAGVSVCCTKNESSTALNQTLAMKAMHHCVNVYVQIENFSSQFSVSCTVFCSAFQIWYFITLI